MSAIPIVAVAKARIRLLVSAEPAAFIDIAARKLSRVKLSAAGNATAIFWTDAKSNVTTGRTTDTAR